MSGVFEFDPDRFIDRPAEPAKVVPLRRIPDAWEHGLTLLHDRIPPPWATPERWAQVVSDALRLATTYQQEVLEAEWSIENLFGFDPARVDGFYGLAVALRGGNLVRIDATEAMIRLPR